MTPLICHCCNLEVKSWDHMYGMCGDYSLECFHDDDGWPTCDGEGSVCEAISARRREKENT